MATQLLLLEDVDDLGKKGEVVSVKEGYAYNYLIPQKFALIASPSALRRQVKLQEERRKIAERDLKVSQEQAQKLQGLVLNFIVKVDHEGHMYGSVSQLDIVHRIKEETQIELEKKAIQLKHHIKETGVFDIPLRLKEEVMVTIQLKVVPEEMPVSAE